MSGRRGPRLYTTQEAAELLGVASSTIRSWKRRELVEPRDYVRGRGPSRSTPLYALADLRPLVTRLRVSQGGDTPGVRAQ